MWICRVCNKEAKWILDCGTSQLNKKGQYKVMRMAYCDLHKPVLISMDKYIGQKTEK